MKTNWPSISCQASLILAKAHKQKSRTHGCGFFNALPTKKKPGKDGRSPRLLSHKSIILKEAFLPFARGKRIS
jgi:hypothetical protein